MESYINPGSQQASYNQTDESSSQMYGQSSSILYGSSSYVHQGIVNSTSLNNTVNTEVLVHRVTSPVNHTTFSELSRLKNNGVTTVLSASQTGIANPPPLTNPSNTEAVDNVASSTNHTIFSQPSTSNNSDATTVSVPQFNTLLHFLKHDADGQILLKKFETKKFLSYHDKNVLTSKIILRERDECIKKYGLPLIEFKIKSDRFVQLSNEISEIFNEQSKIYYIPHSNVGGKINQAAGKLWNAFNNIKKSMRSNDMLLPKIKNTNESEPMEINVAYDSESSILMLNELENNKIEPWEDVKNSWLKTFHLRNRKLFFDNLSVAEYMTAYQCLSLNTGYQLLMLDFDQLYPGRTLALETSWRPFCNQILQLLRTSRVPKTLENQTLLSGVDKLPPNAQNAVVLHLLSTMITPTQMKYGSKNKKQKTNQGAAISVKEKARNVKFSAAEIEQSFIFHVKNASDVDRKLQQKREELYLKKLRLQPLMVFVGPEIDQLESFYVVVDEKRYRVSSALEAVDLTFKLFYALDIQYPLPSYGVWLVFQKLIYKINDGERCSIQLESLISDIKTGLV